MRTLKRNGDHKKVIEPVLRVRMENTIRNRTTAMSTRKTFENWSETPERGITKTGISAASPSTIPAKIDDHTWFGVSVRSGGIDSKRSIPRLSFSTQRNIPGFAGDVSFCAFAPISRILSAIAKQWQDNYLSVAAVACRIKRHFPTTRRDTALHSGKDLAVSLSVLLRNSPNI